MRQNIILLCLLILLFSCKEKEHDGYTLTVELDVPEQSYLYFWQEEFKKGIRVDSVLVEEGKGVFKGMCDELTRVEVCTEAGDRVLWLYAQKGDKITIKGSIKSPYEIELSGTPEHELISRFRNENHKLLQKIYESDTAYYTHMNDTSYRNTVMCDHDSLHARVTDFVMNNPATIASTILIYDYLLDSRITEHADTLLRRLPPEVKPVSLLAKAELFIAGNDKHPVGKILPYMTFRTAHDSVVNTGGFRRRTTLFIVWASYDTLSRQQMQVMRRLEKKYPRNFLNLVSVSVDTDQEAWQSALQNDSIGGRAHCRLKEGWLANQIENLGVRTLPATFLLNASGRIVAKNLLNYELEAATDSLVAEIGEDESMNKKKESSNGSQKSKNTTSKRR